MGVVGVQKIRTSQLEYVSVSIGQLPASVRLLLDSKQLLMIQSFGHQQVPHTLVE